MLDQIARHGFAGRRQKPFPYLLEGSQGAGAAAQRVLAVSSLDVVSTVAAMAGIPTDDRFVSPATPDVESPRTDRVDSTPYKNETIAA